MTDFKYFGYMSTYSFSYSKTFQLYLKRDNSSSLHWSWDIRYWNSLSPHCYYIQIRGITKKVREIERDKKQRQQCGEEDDEGNFLLARYYNSPFKRAILMYKEREYSMLFTQLYNICTMIWDTYIVNAKAQVFIQKKSRYTKIAHLG